MLEISNSDSKGIRLRDREKRNHKSLPHLNSLWGGRKLITNQEDGGNKGRRDVQLRDGNSNCGAAWYVCWRRRNIQMSFSEIASSVITQRLFWQGITLDVTRCPRTVHNCTLVYLVRLYTLKHEICLIDICNVYSLQHVKSSASDSIWNFDLHSPLWCWSGRYDISSSKNTINSVIFMYKTRCGHRVRNLLLTHSLP